MLMHFFNIVKFVSLCGGDVGAGMWRDQPERERGEREREERERERGTVDTSQHSTHHLGGRRRSNDSLTRQTSSLSVEIKIPLIGYAVCQ